MLAGFEVARADQARRQKVADGIEVMPLQPSASSDLAAMLIEFAPGAVFGEEIHKAWEILYVLEGEFHDGAYGHSAGTLISAQEGSIHWPQSKTGCRVLVLYPNGTGE
ncbi:MULTISPECIES: cupin domain-containing protein [unclassified Streptomyces]|uniref:cupin domain-containing protein n=1 Tax=unclassified Streptomyces TaxID=2593676 RepID=UPI0033BE8B0D